MALVHSPRRQISSRGESRGQRKALSPWDALSVSQTSVLEFALRPWRTIVLVLA